VPGALATTFTPTQSSVAQQWATTLPLPTMLGGVSVAVGGTATYANSTSTWTYSATGSVLAPLLYVSATQINFQMPPGIQGELVPVQISYPNGTTLLTSVRAGSTDPGIFTLTSVPTGPAAVLNQDNSVNLGGNPAARGSVIQIFATGAGATNPSLAAGVPAPASGSPLIYTQVQPTVTIGGVNAAVQFSGLAPGFVGVWQINAVVPPTVTPGSTVSLSVTAGGIQSNTATIAVK
jgi:adhesin/invasin